MVERWSFFFDQRWESSGWFRIDPGDCRTWNRGEVNTHYYLSVVALTDEGARVSDYGLVEVPDWHVRSGAYGIEEFFCASDEAFGRQAEGRSALRQCRDGEYLQLFNVHVFVEYNRRYTLNLN